MVFGKIIAVHNENNMNPINTLRGQNAELLNISTAGTHNYHCAVKRHWKPLLKAVHHILMNETPVNETQRHNHYGLHMLTVVVKASNKQFHIACSH